MVCGFEFVLSCLYEAGQEGKAKLKKLMKNVVLNVTFLHLFGMFLWAFQDEKVYVETIILVLRSCKLVEARWSCGHLCEDFWFSSKKYHLKCCPGLTHYKKILQFVHVAGLLGGLVDWLGLGVSECISCIWFWRSNFVIFADSAKKQVESVQITLRPMGLFFAVNCNFLCS